LIHGRCHTCGYEIFASEIFCTTCWKFDNYPNVKRALLERDALIARETAARDRVIDQGAANPLIRMEQLIATYGRVVIAMSAHTLHSLLRDPREFYSNVERRIVAGSRRVPEPDFEEERARGASVLGGTSVTSELCYAALSINGIGPRSFGCASVTLKDILIVHRVSLLEENSYTFQQRYPTGHAPPGYRATWEDRVALTTAKFGPSLASSTTDDDLKGMVLLSNGTRADEKYLEAHIYGRIKATAFERVVAGDPEDADETTSLAMARGRALALGIAWESAS
jgi:hypothetical protein